MKKDVQNEEDYRQVKLDTVGVTGVNIPIKVKDKKKGDQYVAAEADAFVSLEHTQKGIHMSHIIDLLFQLREKYGLDQLVKVAKIIKDKQTKENKGTKTKYAELALNFKYFVDKEAPVSKVKSIMAYDVEMRVEVGSDNIKATSIRVPVSTCCPCSLELCDGVAAHNQRGIITITSVQQIADKRTIWFEDIIKIAEASGSCEIWPVLRRPDEEFVTKKMFEKPKFVEDVVRDTVINLRKKYKNVEFQVSCENMESIHDHSAFAETKFNT